MAVYNKSGIPLSVLYDKNGESLQYVYDKSGNQLLEIGYYITKFNGYVDNYIQENGMYIDGAEATRQEIEFYLLNRNNCLYRGKLRKAGKYLVDKNGDNIDIQGIGTHHLTQYSNLHTLRSLEVLKYCGINTIRMSAYLNDHNFSFSDRQTSPGYLTSPDSIKAEMDRIIGYCIALGLYVIVDWHVWSGGGEYLSTSSAVEFFTYFAQKYHDCDNILYELANEPFKDSLSDTVNHCITVRDVIRTYVTEPILITGAMNGTNGVYIYDALINEGINDIFISQHRYSGGASLSVFEGWWENDIPLFISEWANTSSSTGSQSAVDVEEGNAFLNFFNQNHIPNCIWKFTDQKMSYSALANKGSINNQYYQNGAIDEEDFSVYGKFIFDRYSAFSFG